MLAPATSSGTNTLRSVEQQINQLQTLRHRRRPFLPFPTPWEQAYLQHRQQRFLEVDFAMMLIGMVLYLSFAWADWVFGGDQSLWMVAVRAMLTLALLLLALHLRQQQSARLIPMTAIGIALVGGSIVAFTTQLEGAIRFAYHIGIIPVQVFAMVLLRNSVRSFFTCSLAMLGVYIVTAWWLDEQASNAVEAALLSLRPLFILFWLLLIILGTYLALAMERVSRLEFVQNRALELEAQRQQHLVEQLHQLSITDGLTGIANRRQFELRLQEEWQRARRYGQWLSLLMIDVDDFKAFNDTLGHPSGDAALRQVAAQLHSVCQRSGDVCARYGGEEFVLLLADTPAEAAHALAERVRQLVLALDICHPASKRAWLSVSVGVASRQVDGSDSAAALLRQADQALYQAKRQGRNQVCLAASSVSS